MAGEDARSVCESDINDGITEGEDVGENRGPGLDPVVKNDTRILCVLSPLAV